MSAPLFKQFPKNELGRDFIIGDLHGMFHTLETLMGNVGFDKKADRLFSVGDLMDRGPQSQRLLEFIDQPWFFAIQGNHEQLLVHSKNSLAIRTSWVERAGGDWWLETDPDTQEKLYQAVKDLPIAFEVATANGNIGIVHADVPIGLTWQEFINGLADDKDMQQQAIWSRVRHRHAAYGQTVPAVEGIDLLVVGHSIVEESTLLSANIHFIDTGAAYTTFDINSRLTMLQIHPVREVHQQETS